MATAQPSGVEARRAFIRERLEQAPSLPLTFREVLANNRKVSDTSLYKDAEALRRQGCPIEVSHKQFVYNSERLSTVGSRTRERVREKASIGRTAARLLLPLQAEREAILGLAGVASRGQLPARLREYWDKAHRVVSLDSGSTTGLIARLVEPIRAPDARRHLAHLRIVTNGVGILRELSTPRCSHGLIFLGGALRYDTGAIAGTMAEACLDAWRLQADVAVVGTTNLNQNGSWCCDNEDEASIKSRLLSAARIRCVAADSKKLVNPGRGSSFPFAHFSESNIDVVLTDPLILEKHKGEEEERRNDFHRRAQESGLLVLTEPLKEYKAAPPP